ncbi:MAG: hypothetical protein WD178_10045, partial [Actinomycetota bacterium]
MSEEGAEAGAEAKAQAPAGTPGTEEAPSAGGPTRRPPADPPGTEEARGADPASDSLGSGPLAEFLVAVRRRPALTIFLFGLILFAGGLVSVIGSQIRGAGNDLPV